MSLSLTPPARFIDPRGQRFGAGASVVILATAAVLGHPLLVGFVAVALGVSSAFGTRYSILGRPWPFVRRFLGLGPTELEHEYPPRFAQALGAVGLALGLILLVGGVTPLGWILVIGVAALQALLAVTGYCLGCRLYFLRWMVPGLFARAIGRGATRPGQRLSGT
jgi:hypothetical protein